MLAPDAASRYTPDAEALRATVSLMSCVAPPFAYTPAPRGVKPHVVLPVVTLHAMTSFRRTADVLLATKTAVPPLTVVPPKRQSPPLEASVRLAMKSLASTTSAAPPTS